jgi:transposase
MAKSDSHDPKLDALARSATLHPHPERVTDELFQQNPFFDARDSLQVKYEMLRRVRVDGYSVSRAAGACGFSRPTYYQARDAFERGGLAALLPEKKGPKRGHKLTNEVLAFIETELEADPDQKPAVLARRIEQQLGIRVHPKSIGRARARSRGGGKKNRPTRRRKRPA